MENIVYTLGDSVYINLTNRCSNHCEFCVRIGESFKKYGLWLEHEPSAQEIIEALKDYQTDEIVFCGFGEPLYRLDVMLEVADYAHAHNMKTRVNTNGQAKLIAGAEDAAKRMQGKLDKVNVSLNASAAKGYQDVCKCEFGEKGFEAMLEFAAECKKYVGNVVFSVVDVIGEEEVAACKKLAEEMGIPLRVRVYVP